MQSLERALLTLALLVLWTWFTQFLIVWLANVPAEAAWYVTRESWPYPLILGLAVASLVAAVVMLVPPGFGRRTMIAGSALLLLSHGTYMVWVLAPAARNLSLASLASAVALAGIWAIWFALTLKRRRAVERIREEDRQFAPG
jgi:hypothetical protein